MSRNITIINSISKKNDGDALPSNQTIKQMNINERFEINRNSNLNMTFNRSFYHDRNGFNIPTKLPGFINEKQGNLRPNEIKTSTDINTCINGDGSITLIVNTVINIRHMQFRTKSTVRVPRFPPLNPLFHYPTKQDPIGFKNCFNQQQEELMNNIKQDPENVIIKEDPGQKRESQEDEEELTSIKSSKRKRNDNNSNNDYKNKRKK